MKCALFQLNPLIGDTEGNSKKILAAMKSAKKAKAELLVCPELSILGYPPRDLLTWPMIVEAEQKWLRKLGRATKEIGIGLVIGHTTPGLAPEGLLLNSASLWDEGRQLALVHKRRLPNYDIFEERRYFHPMEGPAQGPFPFRDELLHISICEDAWEETPAFGIHDKRSYGSESDPWRSAASASLLVNLSASPYTIKKRLRREELFQVAAMSYSTPLLYCNCVGGQDDLLFDGSSFACMPSGKISYQAQPWKEEILIVDTQETKEKPREYLHWEELLGGLACGISDYFQKNKLSRVELGLSGGIDSALCAWLATQAVGPENVYCSYLPSDFSSELSREICKKLTQNLGCNLEEISIQEPLQEIATHINADQKGVPFENLQARLRGLILMYKANERNALLLSTSNKSESAMGYATLYGDMSGGLAPIGDLYKTEVYGLCHFINHKYGNIFPQELLDREPSAELAPGQMDKDSLPAYPVLDSILKPMIEDQMLCLRESAGWEEFSTQTGINIRDIARRLNHFEYKRDQAARALRVHHRAFGPGWRFPISKANNIP